VLVHVLVRRMSEWPTISAMTFRGTPWAPSRDMQAWRKSWKRCFGSPAAATSALNSRKIFLSSIGVPIVEVKT
jgi:hypothetical protein